MKFKMFILLNIEAESYWQARDIVWKLIPNNMKPVVLNVFGKQDLKLVSVWDHFKYLLTGK